MKELIKELDEQFQFSMEDYENWDSDKLADAFKTSKARSEKTLTQEPRRDQYKVACGIFKAELDKRRKEA